MRWNEPGRAATHLIPDFTGIGGIRNRPVYHVDSFNEAGKRCSLLVGMWLRWGSARLSRPAAPLRAVRVGSWVGGVRALRVARRAAHADVPAGTVINKAAHDMPGYVLRLNAMLRASIKSPQYLIHIANGFALLAMGSQDMLNLRTFMILGNLCGIAYNLAQSPPLLPPVCWGMLFTMGHAVQIFLLFRKHEINLTQRELDFYEAAFLPYSFTPRDFKTLIDECDASWWQVPKGHVFCRKGEEMPHIWYLVKGKADVQVNDDRTIAFVPGRGAWLGEFWDPNFTGDSRTRQHAWRATITADEDCEVVQVDRLKLRLALESRPQLMTKADRVQIGDLWGKLQSAEKGDALETYRNMVKVALVDGTLDPAERRMLDEWRAKHHISDEQHTQVCSSFCLSVEDWKKSALVVRRLSKQECRDGQAPLASPVAGERKSVGESLRDPSLRAEVPALADGAAGDGARSGGLVLPAPTPPAECCDDATPIHL
eukprot:g77730.t1